jgi:hypothetical protein
VIVFDLQCERSAHVFEIWFNSTGSYETQRERGLIECPFCGDTKVEKAVMAPRIGSKSNQQNEKSVAVLATNDAPTQEDMNAAIAALAKAQAKALETSTWVGTSFDSQARAMEAGDIPTASIHGQATAEQAKALIDDGIAVMPLPFPVIPPNQRN